MAAAPAFNRAAARIAARLGAMHRGWARIRAVRLHDVAAEPGRSAAPHAHAWFELSLIASGCIAYRCGGVERRLRAGAVFAMPPGVRHGWTCVAPAVITGWQLLLAPAEAASRAAHAAWCARLAAGAWSLPPHPLGRTLVAEIHALAQVDEAAAAELARAWLGWSLARLGLGEAAEPGPPPADERIARLREHLLEHLAEELPLAALAQRFGVSPRHLDRTFAAATGMPIRRFVTAERLERAAQALRSGDDSVAAIARGVGYRDPAWFGRRFRSRFGQSPERWRNAGR